jgi:hypothetical protein
MVHPWVLGSYGGMVSRHDGLVKYGPICKSSSNWQRLTPDTISSAGSSCSSFHCGKENSKINKINIYVWFMLHSDGNMIHTVILCGRTIIFKSTSVWTFFSYNNVQQPILCCYELTKSVYWPCVSPRVAVISQGRGSRLSTATWGITPGSIWIWPIYIIILNQRQ